MPHETGRILEVARADLLDLPQRDKQNSKVDIILDTEIYHLDSKCWGPESEIQAGDLSLVLVCGCYIIIQILSCSYLVKNEQLMREKLIYILRNCHSSVLMNGLSLSGCCTLVFKQTTQ